ncbi:MAG: response regulator transcription factor [Vicinamibacterales bacterium]
MRGAVLVSVVDDDDSIRRALRRLIGSTGLEVDTFGSAEEFLEKGNRETACLILDVRLPGMSGLELQHQLAGADPRISIIFMSAYGSEDLKDHAIMAGALGFLDKPIAEDLLLDQVRLALDARR